MCDKLEINDFALKLDKLCKMLVKSPLIELLMLLNRENYHCKDVIGSVPGVIFKEGLIYLIIVKNSKA